MFATARNKNQPGDCRRGGLGGSHRKGFVSVVQARGLLKSKDMVKFRKANRLAKFDYSQPGFYFVTLCTDEKRAYFGNINKGKMILNPLGEIAKDVWKRTPKVYPHAAIDEFVIMPNHMHGIVIIGDVKNRSPASLSQIIGSYKNVVTKQIGENFLKIFAWQPSFYDHVIRNGESLDNIRKYIRNNPIKWELDRNNPANLWM